MGVEDVLGCDGLSRLVWRECDEVLGGALVASPADAKGRGISLVVERAGAAVDLTGASAYLVWRHRATRARGCEPFEAVDAAAGAFRVFYPAAMAAAEGTVDAQVLLSWGGRSLSSRAFCVRVEQVLVGGAASGDGFSLFLDALKKYEAAASDALLAADELRRRADAGEFDGADGRDGRDGVDGAPGKDGERGPAGPAGPVGPAFTYSDFSAEQLEGLRGPAGPAGEKGDKGDAGAAFSYSDFTAEQLEALRGPAGADGRDGVDGKDGAAGAKGDKGDKGDAGAAFTFADFTAEQLESLRGPAGPAGADGKDGVDGKDGADVDLSGYATTAYVDSRIASIQSLEEVKF